MEKMRVAYKVWLDKDGKAFGEGPFKLLKLVEKTGSLHRAAMEMRMSYRKAWLTIHSIEEKLGFPLLDKHVGGRSGGGSTITAAGNEFMSHYEGFRGDVHNLLEELYQKHFG
jgi:molybdate transport system regulatory protein